jgi:polyisoprenyl-phosphate glycosyltransferase
MVIIDVDCEDPPEMLISFIRLYEAGYDFVYGIRKDRVENFLLKKMRNLFYKIMKALSDDEIVLYMAEFALITEEVRDAVIDSSDSFPFVRSTLSRIGFQSIGVPYKRGSRVSGRTHYNFASMTVFAIGGILSSTTLPLRLPIYLLPFLTFSLVPLAYSYYNNGRVVHIVIASFLIFFYFAFATSMIAIYLARTYKNGLGRPIYIIDKRNTSVPYVKPSRNTRKAR